MCSSLIFSTAASVLEDPLGDMGPRAPEPALEEEEEEELEDEGLRTPEPALEAEEEEELEDEGLRAAEPALEAEEEEELEDEGAGGSLSRMLGQRGIFFGANTALPGASSLILFGKEPS
jgi:hypothetical protein